jgi:hypothetical protein
MLNQLVLNLATSSGTHTENRVAFSLMPFLTPNEVYDSKSNKKGFKRIRKHVMFDIDPLPDKISIGFNTGHQGDQAFIGDPYNLKIKIDRKEQVTLKSLNMIVLDIISGPTSKTESVF